MKNLRTLREELVRNLTVDFLDEVEISSIIRDIDSLDSRIRQKTLALCLALSHASSSLVSNILKKIRKVSPLLPIQDRERWITQAFDLLDAKGIDAFMTFVSRTDEESLREFMLPEGLRLKDIALALETYLKGISGLDLKIGPNETPYTDTATVFLPPFIDRFAEEGKNLLLCKMTAAYLWAQIAGGTVTPGEEELAPFLREPIPNHPDIWTLFLTFDERALAVEVYTILEARRCEGLLRQELPRLMDEAKEIKEALLSERPSLMELPEKTAFVEGLYRCLLREGLTDQIPPDWERIYQRFLGLRDAPLTDSISLLREICGITEEMAGEYQGLNPAPFFGIIRPQRVSLQIQSLKTARRKKLEALITRITSLPDFEPRKLNHGEAAAKEQLLPPQKEYLLIRGRLVELDSEMREYIEEKGGIPGGILVKGSDFGSGSPITLSDLLEEEEEVPGGNGKGGIRYDEWDYKRGGYKRQWCSLYEHDLHPGHEPFVELTLSRYGGYVNSLRKRFELLRRETRIMRRQKEGDDIDIDGMVEAFSDMRAGLPPGENLFTRLDRQERNVAVLFLLDMSGSTKGWVNQAEKEALVLMCEALDSLGDRYAICGFSGMTRTRCDFYTVKKFGEQYGETVKGRISGIAPKDYTRMGPPLRHATGLLTALEARTKILITLSDGKPEDWDAYKGDYAIEDTRRALGEAREQGIHPFCITIDREASSYLPHMFGEAHYIVIDDVKKLPAKITEIYRRLTQ